MDSWVRFTAQSQSKEKLIRAAQYACMLLGHALHRSRPSRDVLRTVSELEQHLGMSRKLLRVGASLEALQAAQRSVHLSDGVLRLCLTVAHLNRALYLLSDNLLWAAKTRILPSLDQDRWTRRSYRFFLVSSILALSRDVYELGLLLDQQNRSRGSKAPPVPTAPPSPVARLQQHLRRVLAVLREHPALLLDLLRNSCDIIIPLDRLGLYRTGPGAVGAAGLLSSLLAILTLLHPWLRLKP